MWLRVELVFQVVVGFGIFGLGCLFLTLMLLPLWCVSGFRKSQFQVKVRTAVSLMFRFVLFYLEKMRFLRLEIQGDEKTLQSLKSAEPKLYVGNHVSLFDVLVVLAQCPQCLTFVKSSLANNPLLHAIVRCAGYIPVPSSDPAGAALAYDFALKQLKSGHSLVVFPEGTRSSTGQLGRLQKGAFRLSRLSGVPITPVEFRTDGPLINSKTYKRSDGKPTLLKVIFHGLGTHRDPAKPDECVAWKEFLEKRQREQSGAD
jgi:1-acyl-sn-glycerol-3-phosphate acyltransferase